MFVYTIGTLISIFNSMFVVKDNPLNGRQTMKNNFFAFLSAVPLFIISAFRYNVGADYGSYKIYFNTILSTWKTNNVEIGFNYLTIIINKVFNDYNWFIIITSFIFIFLVFKAIYQQSDNPTFSIFLFVATQYYFASFNGIRQMISIAIFIYSIKYIKNRNLKKYLLWIISASFIHYSSIIFLPLYFLYGVKIKPKIQIIILSTTVFFKTSIRYLFLHIISSSKYMKYIGSQYDDTNVGVITIFVELAVLILAWLFYSKNDRDDQKQYDFFCNLKMISVMFSLLDGVIPLISRLKWGFGFTTIFLIPLIIKRIDNKKIRFLISLLVIIFYSVYIIYKIAIMNSNMVLPYYWIWSD